MTIALSQLTDLQRVRIALSNRVDGTMLVERSATSGFQLPSTVRGGVALPISAGVGQLDDYEFYADVQNWYRVTPVDPPGGLLLPGVAGDYASTPSNAALNITGNFEIVAEVTPDDTTPVAPQYIASRYGGAGVHSWFFRIRPTGVLSLGWSADGTADISRDSTVAPTFPASGRLAVRATLDPDNGAAGHTVRFYTAESLATVDAGDAEWTQLGTSVVNAGLTSVFNAAAPMEVGSFNGGTSPFAGTIHQVRVYNGFLEFGGTAVANPDFGAQTSGAANFVDAAGRTWTVNGNADIEGVETATITPSLNGQVWLKSVRYPLQNVEVRVASPAGDISVPARAAAFPVEGRALPTGVFELGLGRDHELILRTTTQADEDHVKLMVRSGDWFFIHVPTVATNRNVLLPGSMYVLIGNVNIHRAAGISGTHLISLPITEVTPPGPDVVGATLTVGGLVALHGSVTSVWAAYPTIRDQWNTIADLDTLVTI